MAHSQHDELAQLFAQNMQLSQPAPTFRPQQAVDAMPLGPEQKSANEVHYIASPVHFISSHYTQTAHVRAETQSEPSRSPPPSYQEAMMPHAMAETLRQNSINPSALLPNQIQLFANADYEQRLRLLELWRIAPPTYPLEEHLRSRSYDTSVEQEEQAAMIRYEQQMQNRSMQPEEHMLDTHVSSASFSARPEPISPVRGPGEDAWPPAARMRAASISQRNSVEPYVADGYRVDSRLSQHAVDPVYGSTPGLWQASSHAHAPQEESDMAAQYGMYEQIRNHADWERMNERIMREKFAGMQTAMDDDMVL